MMAKTHSLERLPRLRFGRKGQAIAVACLCACLSVPVFAEVSTDPLPRRGARTLLMDFLYNGITDGADPIPTVSWQTYRNIPAGRQLNKLGATRPDGRPDVSFRPSTAPIVVWAYNNGEGEHDIAFAVWENQVWGETRFLTHSPLQNDLDPRAFISPNGRFHVVWTMDSVDGAADSKIMLTSLVPDPDAADGDFQLTWTTPTRISLPGEQVARPTVAESHGFLWIAYERTTSHDAGTPSQIVIRRRSLNSVGNPDGETGIFEVADVIPSVRLGALDPLFTAMHGQLWIDWARSDNHFAFKRLRAEDLDWSPALGAIWPEPSWNGVEDVRQTIRRWVLSTSIAADSGGLPVIPDSLKSQILALQEDSTTPGDTFD